ncbi:hypothetical protein [Chryseobacterium mucoviscidosis]|uniref:hypothetical protein n=1 Tax=Chryseobacterium mucoviscidosis TaxID=1945581 RepID=UPI0031DB4FE3
MKKVIFPLMLLLGTFCFSQTATKKYNSFNNQYEYFDSSGNMTGYEKYNSFSKQWEYYTVNTPQSRQPTQYRTPQQLDISALGNAMSARQNRYNNAQATINDIVSQIKSMNISEERKTKILNAVNKTIEMNIERISRGDANWLYEVTNLIIKDTY